MSRKLDIELLVIILVIAVSAGHIGNFLGGFERPNLFWLGYVQAVAIDAALAVCAYRMRLKSQRAASLAGWLFFCGVSAILNAAYYHGAGASVPLAALLGAWAPAAGALLGWLKSTSDAHAERQAKAAEARAAKRAQRAEESEVMPAPVLVPSFTCEGCGYEAASQNALNAHRRWCAGSNGRERAAAAVLQEGRLK